MSTGKLIWVHVYSENVQMGPKQLAEVNQT